MPIVDFLRHVSVGTILSSLLPWGAAVLAALLLVGLRLLRRGPARHWLGPSFFTLSLLPAVIGAGMSAWSVMETAEGVALVGLGGGAALRASLLEAQLPLLSGLLATGAVSLVALLLLAFCVSPAAFEGPDRPRIGALALTAALALVAATLGLLELAAARWVAAGSPTGEALARGVLWSLAATAFGLFLCGIVVAVRAPRAPAPRAVRVVALGAPAALALACPLGSVAGLGLIDHSISALLAEGPAVAPAGDVDELPLVYEPRRLATPIPLGLPPPPPRRATPIPSHTRPAPRAHEVDEPGEPSSADAPAPARQEPVRVGGVIKEPRKLKHVNPVYPDIAQQARVQGVVILECTISPKGKVTDVKVLRGIPLLDQAATDAVRQWIYTPTLLEGVPVPVIMTVTINFKLS